MCSIFPEKPLTTWLNLTCKGDDGGDKLPAVFFEMVFDKKTMTHPIKGIQAWLWLEKHRVLENRDWTVKQFHTPQNEIRYIL